MSEFDVDRVPILLDNAKSRLRGLRRSDDAEFVRRLIALEDWLELAHPRNGYRPKLRDARRKLEVRAYGK